MFAIKTENLFKSYKIRHQSGVTRYKTLQETILNLPRALFRKSSTSENFQALNDVSFEIQPGERVGIIGRNGAGKSTLLKVLSRITEPTSGRVLINGRVASLLEVGTGFHPELTGRENVFMNGAILGMSRAEIKCKFDEIVDFAEVEKFIDTPVKRYSSGMYVRLAFAVAAHLEPEILLVDEVLAVGDAQFQKKCLGKMENVSKQDGRTILFVSHNMAAIDNLCQTCILLDRGAIAFQGKQTDAIARYSAMATSNSDKLMDRFDRGGSGKVKITSIFFKNEQGDVTDIVMSGDSVDICLSFVNESIIPLERVIVSVQIKTPIGQPVFLQHNRLSNVEFGILPKEGTFICKVPIVPLPPSIYNLTFAVHRDGEELDSLNDAAIMNITDGNFYGSNEVPPISHGLCLVDAKWSITPLET